MRRLSQAFLRKSTPRSAEKTKQQPDAGTTSFRDYTGVKDSTSTAGRASDDTHPPETSATVKSDASPEIPVGSLAERGGGGGVEEPPGAKLEANREPPLVDLRTSELVPQEKAAVSTNAAATTTTTTASRSSGLSKSSVPSYLPPPAAKKSEEAVVVSGAAKEPAKRGLWGGGVKEKTAATPAAPLPPFLRNLASASSTPAAGSSTTTTTTAPTSSYVPSTGVKSFVPVVAAANSPPPQPKRGITFEPAAASEKKPGVTFSEPAKAGASQSSASAAASSASSTAQGVLASLRKSAGPIKPVTTPSASPGDRSPVSALFGGSDRAGKSGGARDRTKSQGKYLSTALGTSMFQLSKYEEAFMPGDLLRRLGESAGQLPPAPSQFASMGAVLFVDVSGFTALAEELNTKLVPIKAAKALADIITKVLNVLTVTCLDGGGEVGKFAGDALLCVWEAKSAKDSTTADLDRCELQARHCAVEMLAAMDKLNKLEGTNLGIHGGVAKGSIVHFHLGSADDDLRWYLIAGEAVAAATCLVDVAQRGEFCAQDGLAKGLPVILDMPERPKDPKSPAPIKRVLPGDGLFGSMRGGVGAGSSSNMASPPPARPKTLVRGAQKVSTTFLDTNSTLPPRPAVTEQNYEAVLLDGLPRECNVYIPKELRNQLELRDKRGGEMRRRVAIVFVEIEDLRMTEDELTGRHIQDRKLDSLNEAFVVMTRITHAFGGEVRDMLFDDKGCIFIGIFGAHSEEEKEDNRWNLFAVKAAMGISNELPSARLGVSVGMCFTGLAGMPKRRTDFVVVGHEVNMAARYMANAVRGEVLVSSGVAGTTKDMIKYGNEREIVVGKGQWAKARTVYTPDPASAKRPSFLAQYKRSLRDADVFVGRIGELTLIEDTLSKITQGRSGVIVIESVAGRGKSTLVLRAKKMGRGKIKVVSGSGVASERSTPYFCFRQILEAYTGIRPAMTPHEARTAIAAFEKGERINIAALAQVLPWVGSDGLAKASDIHPDAVADTMLKIIRLKREMSQEDSTLIVVEDVQWLDPASLELLTRLLDGTDKIQRLAVLLTFRKGEPGFDTTPFSYDPVVAAVGGSSVANDAAPATVVDETGRRKLVELVHAKLKKFKFNSIWIDLQPFARNEADYLTSKLLGGDLNEISADKMWNACKGDPLFIEFMVLWLNDNNYVRTEKSGAVTISCDADSMPESVRACVAARLARLTAETKRVLHYAASAGDTFDALFIANTSKAIASAEHKPNEAFSVESALKALHAAADANVLVHFAGSVRDETKSKWRFKHETVHRVVWGSATEQSRVTTLKLAESERVKLAMRLRSAFDANE